MKVGLIVTVWILTLGSPGCGRSEMAEKKKIVGLEEWVVFPQNDHRALAKVDTGADTSSIDATDIARVGERTGPLKRGDEIRFLTRGEDGDKHELRGRIVRFVRIKRKGSASQRRPVIEVEICFGGRKMRVEMTLTDRHNFKFPALIGQKVLSQGFLVDVTRKKVWKADCPAD